MKTAKPNHINYTAQYQMMRLAGAVLPKMPEAILDKFSALVTPRMLQAEEHAELMHPDRYDILVDWGCLAHRAIRTKVSR